MLQITTSRDVIREFLATTAKGVSYDELTSKTHRYAIVTYRILAARELKRRMPRLSNGAIGKALGVSSWCIRHYARIPDEVVQARLARIQVINGRARMGWFRPNRGTMDWL